MTELPPVMNPSYRSGRTLAAMAAVIALGQTQLAQAESRWRWEQAPRVVEDRFRLELGLFGASLDTTARIDAGTDALGTEFNGESDFGLADSKYMAMPELTVFTGQRHLLRLSGFSITRSGHKAVEREIDYDVETFEPGDLVDSTLNIKAVELSYGFRFARFERFEAAGLLGVQIADFTTNAEIRGKTSRDPTGEVAPIPLLGLEARFDLTRKLSLEGRAQYTSVTFQDISGSITDLRLALTWRLNPHLATGLAYSSLQMKAESENEDSAGFADFRMTGPTLFLRVSL